MKALGFMRVIIKKKKIVLKLFDRLRREKPNFRSFVKIVDGDLDNLPMSLSSTDRDWMIRNVNFIFHCAATVKFNEPLEIAMKVNTLGTANLLKLAKEMKNLKVYIIFYH